MPPWRSIDQNEVSDYAHAGPGSRHPECEWEDTAGDCRSVLRGNVDGIVTKTGQQSTMKLLPVQIMALLGVFHQRM
jgi:hypothetical protein